MQNGTMTMTQPQVVARLLEQNRNLRPVELSDLAERRFGVRMHPTTASMARKRWFEKQGKKPPKLDKKFRRAEFSDDVVSEGDIRGSSTLTTALAKTVEQETITEQLGHIKEFATIVKKVGGPKVAEKFLDLLKTIM